MRSTSPALCSTTALLVLLAGCAGEKGCRELKMTTLASGQSEYGAVTTDEGSVYWLDRGTADDGYATGAVMKVDKKGGDAVRLASDKGGGNQIAVDATRVYWIRDGGGDVMAVAKAGGASSARVSGLRTLGGLAVDADSLYVTESVWSGTVLQIPKEGGQAVTIAADQRRPTDVAVDATSVYWIASGSVADGAIWKAPRAGGAPVQLADKQRWPRALAVDASGVYWVSSRTIEPDSQVDRILTVPLAGGAVVVVVDHQEGVLSLALDARNVYWPSMRTGQVLGAPKGGAGAAVVIADKQNGPGAIAVDAQGITWTTDAGATRGAKGARHDGAVRVTVK